MAFETAGTYREGTKSIVHDVDRVLIEATGNKREIFWLMGRLSLTAQRGNTASIP